MPNTRPMMAGRLGSMLLLSVPADVKIAAVLGQTVAIEITDIAGTVTDKQTITVVFGELSDTIFENGFE